MICLEFSLFGSVCALCFVTFDITQVRAVLCFVRLLRYGVLSCVVFILCCVRLVTFVTLSCVMFDC